MKRARRPAAVILALLLAAACGKKGDPARETLDRIVAAAHARDAAAVTRELSEDYRDASGSGRSDVEQTLRGDFAAYEILDVRLSDVTIEHAEGAARARFRAELSGQPRQASGLAGLLPSASSYRFDVRLVPDGSRWKIAWASWEPAGGPSQ
jgi:hypothetical protein